MIQGPIERHVEDFHESWSLLLPEKKILQNLGLCANNFHFGHDSHLSHLVLDRKRVGRGGSLPTERREASLGRALRRMWI